MEEGDLAEEVAGAERTAEGAVYRYLDLSAGDDEELVALCALDAADGPPIQVLDLLGGLPLFAPLPRAVLERLAFDARLVELPAGPVFAQGDAGDRFYVIASGEVDVTVDGAHVRTERRGDGFGEIALLHDTPRTATVTATGPVTLYALDRDAFVTAVTGHPASAEAAERLAASRLATAMPALRPV